MKSVEVAKWLEKLPLAPEFRPTDTEFADPIAYISKIEKEATAFGICKVIPPLPKPSRKYVLHNLNKSLLKRPELGPGVNADGSFGAENVVGGNCDRSVSNGESRAVFTTRSQELGCEKVKKTKGVAGAQKQVWHSGEVYTLEQFEAKSKNFARTQLGTVKDVNPLVIETLFWKAASEKPIYVEYANDVPGSGFCQPEGLMRYYHRFRRRRKRNSFDRNNTSNSCSEKDKVGTGCSSSSIKADKDSGDQNIPNLCTEKVVNSTSSARSGKCGSSVYVPTDSNPSCEMEGSAGWKLSNSPWNLQVIARSAGSLTKFMPDDIPGVTSPMVYVGMLFSWFAWHVEDHELHSLNFLHMGSPKTWYSVPGDQAFNFEETIRLHAYGETIDRSVALSHLGEKTTVLSPEVIMAAGIPCCRLVQHPGEYVVTFPRAYHIGFSHGFNCGEAANFATPNWLAVAKEAAVRRAAMNYLPMLSHQQLLSLLTMSFISRIPRSLLPGVRSSRLRDRQKEERENLVKRAFIDDILNENNLLTVLLERSSTFRSVLWDVESLPSSSKESVLCENADASISASIDNGSSCNDNSVDPVSQLNEYIGVSGCDINDDDLSYDFQVDSGTLPCVACGILGFPFMAVVQPSAAASGNFLQKNPPTDSMECHLLDRCNHVVGESNKVTKAKLKEKDTCLRDPSFPVVNSSQCTLSGREQSPVPDNLSLFKHGAGFPNIEIANGWNVSDLFLKPRVFCLKHALEIEELLRPIGGANVLVICHSDFQKIKAHIASIAEETSTPFYYNEIPLVNASQGDLHLIDIAIDREDQIHCADWTSQLNINLQHYLKVKKNSRTKNVQYALILDGLFGHETLVSHKSSVKWSSRKLRSNRILKHIPTAVAESSKGQMKTNLVLEVAKEEVKIIQYSRRKFKVPRCKDSVNEGKGTSKGTVSMVENVGVSASGLSTVALNRKTDLQHEHDIPLTTEEHFKNLSPPRCGNPLVSSALVVENTESQGGIIPMNALSVEEDTGIGPMCTPSEEEQVGISCKGNELICESVEKNERCSEHSNAPSYGNSRCGNPESQSFTEEQTAVDVERLQDVQSDCDDMVKELSGPLGSSSALDDDPQSGEERSLDAIPDCVMESEVSECSTNEGSYDEAVSRSSSESTPNSVEESRSDHEALSRSSSESTPNLAEESCSDHGALSRSSSESTPNLVEESHSDHGETSSGPKESEFNCAKSSRPKSRPVLKMRSKRKREVSPCTEAQICINTFVKSPCEGLRPRVRKDASALRVVNEKPTEMTRATKKPRKSSDQAPPTKRQTKTCHKCDLDGCKMSFRTKTELSLHKANRCPVDGCRKKFTSHKYAVQHQRVHDDDRPLKCSWKGCTMSFKWAWALTEHLRIHTGERPYSCKVKGCGLTFRFVSDYSRHRRKTGHYVT